MIRLIPFIIAAAVSALSPVHLAGQDDALSAEVNGVVFYYSLGSDGSAVITGADKPSGKFTVPAELDGHPVSAVGERAFFSCKDISSVTFSAPVSVGASAFAGCSSISSFNGMEKVTGLGQYAFTGCSALETIQLPPVSSIPESLCASCTALKTVRFSSKNASVGKEAFFGCSELKIVDIPDSVTSIGDNAFGVVYDLRSDAYAPDKTVLIKCSSTSAACRYADKLGVDFFDPADDQVGDVNRDGFINAADASDVLAEYSLMSTGNAGSFGGYKLYTGDFDRNGRIDASDATAILLEYSRLSTLAAVTTAAAVPAKTVTTASAPAVTTAKTTAKPAASAAKTTAASKSTVTTNPTSAKTAGSSSAVTTAGTSPQPVKTTAAAVKK